MPTTAAARCPRCAYDLSGETARWASACPLSGTCPECGVTLDWSALFRPDLSLTPGFFEHVRGVRRGAPALLRTWLLTLYPLRLWSRVRLEAPVRPRRALLWLTILLLTPRLLGSALNTFWLTRMATHSMQPVHATSVANVWLDGLLWVDLRARPALVGSDLPDTPPAIVPMLLASLAPGVLLLVLSSLRTAANVRAAHVLRASVYSLSWLAPFALLSLLRAAGRAWAVLAAGAAPGVGTDLEGPLARIAHALMYRQPPFIAIVLAAWLALWWSATVIVHFRITRPARLLVLMALVSLLAAVVGLVLNDRLESIVLGL